MYLSETCKKKFTSMNKIAKLEHKSIILSLFFFFFEISRFRSSYFAYLDKFMYFGTARYEQRPLAAICASS